MVALAASMPLEMAVSTCLGFSIMLEDWLLNTSESNGLGDQDQELVVTQE